MAFGHRLGPIYLAGGSSVEYAPVFRMDRLPCDSYSHCWATRAHVGRGKHRLHHAMADGGAGLL